jgi:FkbM family methyltransferase
MTLVEFLFKVAGKFKLVKSVFQAACRAAVSKPGLRKSLNNFYLKLSYNERIYFHFLFSSIFRNKTPPSINDYWRIKFNGKALLLPLRTETLWLDWDLAVSIVGHDLEVKSFYEELIKKSKSQLCFFDIGANYGTHSLLFLSQGMKVVSFEPNPECEPIFNRFLHINSLAGQWEKVGIGESKSVADLVFPKSDTWNGSLNENYQNDLADANEITRIRVEIISVDEFVSIHNIIPDIIKIDTEGYELNVLKGARNTLLNAHPAIVFESNKASERSALFKELRSSSYYIYSMENFFSKRIKFEENQFVDSEQVNFVAINEMESSKY